MVKPHGFVLDFVGIFDKLEKALAFDSDEINAIVKDLGLLKELFKAKMERRRRRIWRSITRNFNDKDVDNLIEHFRDKERRKEFFKEYKEIEMLYEIISPDAFLRPYIDDYTTLSADLRRGGATRTRSRSMWIGRSRKRRTNWCRSTSAPWWPSSPILPAYGLTHKRSKPSSSRQSGNATKIINLVKAIQKAAEENSDDPFLVAMAERAKAVQESFEDRQSGTKKPWRLCSGP